MERREALARGAVELARPTEYLGLQADALFELAVVLQFPGVRRKRTRRFPLRAVIYERKGDGSSLARATLWSRQVLGQ